jgi:hypothetical protein
MPCLWRTNWMGPYRVCVDTEEWNGYKCAVAPQSQHGIPELKSSMMLLSICLVEVDI